LHHSGLASRQHSLCGWHAGFAELLGYRLQPNGDAGIADDIGWACGDLFGCSDAGERLFRDGHAGLHRTSGEVNM
jgi:hypothetical protein